MIPRTARKFETTLLSYSRQRLPRPARYSTPSKPANAPAVAHAFAPVPELPTFMAPSASSLRQVGDDVTSHENNLESFLRRQQPLTIIPPPLPDDVGKRNTSGQFEHYIDTPTQDQLAVIQACLHSLHDVPRAKDMFERMRSLRHGDSILETKLYNSFLHAYLRMADEKDSGNRKMWIEDLWSLYQVMETGYERVEPNESTYAIVLLAWHKCVLRT
jgi:DNA-directed RNA polymerase